MKKIEALIKPFKLEEIVEALKAREINHMTVAEVKVAGDETSQHCCFRGASYNVDFVARLRVELVVEDCELAAAVEIIAAATRTDGAGSASVLVCPVIDTISIGEGGERIARRDDAVTERAERFALPLAGARAESPALGARS